MVAEALDAGLERQAVDPPDLDTIGGEGAEDEVGDPLRVLVARRPGVHLETAARLEARPHARQQRAHHVEAVLAPVRMQEVAGAGRNQLERRVDQHEIETVVVCHRLEETAVQRLERNVAARVRQVDGGIRLRERERARAHVDAHCARGAAARRRDCVDARAEAELQHMVALAHVHGAHQEHLLQHQREHLVLVLVREQVGGDEKIIEEEDPHARHDGSPARGQDVAGASKVLQPGLLDGLGHERLAGQEQVAEAAFVARKECRQRRLHTECLRLPIDARWRKPARLRRRPPDASPDAIEHGAPGW